MTEHQRLFLVQARTDYKVFEKFRKDKTLPHCHALHYLQMATELLGKAYAWKQAGVHNTHRAFVTFLRSLSTHRQAQKVLGYAGRNDNWAHLLRKSVPLAERVEDLAPALAQDGPNPEYPWPSANPATAPAEYAYPLWQELQETPMGRQFLSLIGNLFAAADSFL